MTEHPGKPESSSDTSDYPGTPRWVTIFGIVVLVLILVVVVIMATGVGGEHGPRRHMSSGGAAEHVASVAGVEQS